MVIRDFTTLEALRSLDVTSEKSEVIEIDNETLVTFENDPRVSKTYPIVELGAQLEYDNSITDVAVISFEADTVGMWDSFLFEHSINTSDFSGNNIIISRAALNLIGIQKIEDGQEVDLGILTKGFAGDTEKVEDRFQVLTVIENIDTPIVLVPIDYLQQNGVDRYTLVKVLMKNTNDIDEYRILLERDGYKTRSAYDTVSEINNYFEVVRLGLAIFGVIAMSIAVLGMFNTLTVSLMEKFDEIGIMKALGAGENTILNLFIAESILISLGGAMAGIVTGILASTMLQEFIGLLGKIRKVDTMADLFYFPLDFIIVLVTILLVVGLYFPKG